MRIVAVVGARPSIMKIALLMWEINRRTGIDAYFVHTGQHYDEWMSELVFGDLGIPRSDVDLGMGSRAATPTRPRRL
jgi:UDP-N-acetylglucosamine 2-epimerase (non-hydrolysing)